MYIDIETHQKKLNCKWSAIMQNASIRAWEKTGKYFLKAHKEIEKLKSIHKGETAYLIGNGPSVDIRDLEELNGRITFCCNRFYLSYKDHSFRPMYTVCADAQMLEDFGKEICYESAGKVFLCSDKMQCTRDNSCWIYLKPCNVIRFQKLQEGVLHTGATLLAALQIGHHMGINKFILYGVDHDFKFSSKVGNSELVEGEGNHFIKNYRGGKAWMKPEAELIEMSFAEFDRLLRAEGGFIMNASRKSKLPNIERISFENALVK